MYPAAIATIYEIKNILIELFLLSLYFNNAKVPTPALVVNPVNKAPKLKPPLTYNWVRITDPAQLGIKPIIPALNGWKNQFVFNKLLK